MRTVMLWLSAALLTSVSQILAAGPTGPSQGNKSAEIERAVLRYFQSGSELGPNDLITRDDAAPLLAQLRQRKLLSAAAEKAILAKLLSPDEFLAEQSQSPAGQSFMRKIALLPNGYDRLDRLSRMPYGQQTVRDLIRGPGGEQLIKYMTTTSGGKALGKQLANAPDGADFNLPTGRIYTAAMLMDSLRRADSVDAKSSSAKR